MNSIDHKKLSFIAGVIVLSASLLAGLGLVQLMEKPEELGGTKRPASNPCAGIEKVWKHVYSGDPRKFSKPQDRLQVIEPCKTVTGTLLSAKKEADGDWHLRLDVDDKSLLNAKNKSGQKNALVLEPICSNPVTQRDTLKERSCDGYSQHIFDKSMLNERVLVTGAYVTDMEHGWNEIHPVLEIRVEK